MTRARDGGIITVFSGYSPSFRRLPTTPAASRFAGCACRALGSGLLEQSSWEHGCTAAKGNRCPNLSPVRVKAPVGRTDAPWLLLKHRYMYLGALLDILTHNKYVNEHIRIQGRQHFPRADCSLVETACPLARRVVHPRLQTELGYGAYASPHTEDDSPIISWRLVLQFTLHQTGQISPQGYT